MKLQALAPLNSKPQTLAPRNLKLRTLALRGAGREGAELRPSKVSPVGLEDPLETGRWRLVGWWFCPWGRQECRPGRGSRLALAGCREGRWRV